MSEPWQRKVGLWLARKGGWLPPDPVTIVQPDPAVVAERDEMVIQVKALQDTLHAKDYKLQMRDAKITQLEARAVGLEYDLATASNTVVEEQRRQYADAIAELQKKIGEQQALLNANLGSLSVAPDVLVRARELADMHKESMGGEAKRHVTYARLIKDFPEVSKRDVGLAIELALRSYQA